jgi:hypothetical protein
MCVRYSVPGHVPPWSVGRRRSHRLAPGHTLIETISHKEIDVAEVDMAKVDGDLLALAARLGP